MKKNTNDSGPSSIFIRLSLAVILTTSLAFKIGEQVELEAYLNGRTQARFTKNNNNIGTTLLKGTRGEVLETKKMPSGNYGIKIKVQDGIHKGESYWVYYNLKAPLIKLLNVAKNDVEKSKKVSLLADQKGYREPAEANIIDAATIAVKALNKNSISEIVKNPKSRDCSPLALDLTSVPEDQYNETDLVAPYRQMASSPLSFTTTRSSVYGWDQRYYGDSKKIDGFSIRNTGPNNIVKEDENSINREMSFEFPDRAGSDMKLIICDSPDTTTSHSTYSILMFFPRSVLPSIKKLGDEFQVTLPNKELVRYNSKTGEVLGGVFQEGPMLADPKNKNKAFPANVKYSGDGVMIRADKSGDLPYGDIELSSGTSAPSISIATVSKKGFKDCKIPSKELWYTDHSKGGQVFIKPELANDQGMDAFIKNKCGFSLF